MRIECDACGGTGLYSGFAEPKGVAVVCGRCSGRGYYLSGKPFKKLRRKRGVHTVWIRNTWYGRPPESITEDEFYGRRAK